MNPKIKDVFNKYKIEIDKSLEFLKTELQKVRTGQASPSLVEDVVVDYMGSKMPIKHLGSISCPEPRQILIQPWDKTCLEAIEKALHQANVGVSPVVDKDQIRLTLPPLTEEYRKELIRSLSEKKEATRQALRRWRQEISKETEALFSGKLISEDEKFKAKDELQTFTDDYNKKIDEAVEKKEKEIMG